MSKNIERELALQGIDIKDETIKALQARVEELEEAIDGLSILDMGNYYRVTQDSLEKLGRAREALD